MTESKIISELNEIFRDLFDDDDIEVTRKTTADDIDDWDSLEHINLIGAVERKYNVGEMIDIIMERAK